MLSVGSPNTQTSQIVTEPSKPLTVEGVITRMTFGRYQFRLFATLTLVMFADGYDSILTPIVAELLRKHWSLSDIQSAMLGGVRYFGMIIAAVFLGGLGDWAGRRKTLRYALILLVIATFISTAMPEFWSFIVTRIIVGVLIGCCKPVVSCLAVELSPVPIRAAMSIGLFIFYSCGSLTSVGLAFVFTPNFDPERYWALLIVQAVILTLAMGASLLWVEESPSFLYIKDHPEAAIVELNRIALRNRQKQLSTEEAATLTITKGPAIPQKFSVRRLFSRRYVVRTCYGCLLWWAGSYCLYGFLFILPRRYTQGGSEMTSMVIEISMMIPSSIVATPLVRWFKEVHVMLVFSITMTLSAMSCAFLDSSAGAVMSSAYMFTSNALTLVLYPYTTELFDAALRNTGFSFCSLWSRIAGVVSPFILVALVEKGEDVAFFSFAAHGCMATIVLLMVWATKRTQVDTLA